MKTVTTEHPAFGTVEQIADVLRMNNPTPSLVDSRALAVIEVLIEAPAAKRYVRNALAAAKLVRAEITAAR